MAGAVLGAVRRVEGPSPNLGGEGGLGGKRGGLRRRVGGVVGGAIDVLGSDGLRAL